MTHFITKNGKKIPIGKRKEIVVDFDEELALKAGQKNPKNIGRIDHELLLDIEHAKKQLRMSKGQPLRQSFFKEKIRKLESKKTIIRSHLA